MYTTKIKKNLKRKNAQSTLTIKVSYNSFPFFYFMLALFFLKHANGKAN